MPCLNLLLRTHDLDGGITYRGHINGDALHLYAWSDVCILSSDRYQEKFPDATYCDLCNHGDDLMRDIRMRVKRLVMNLLFYRWEFCYLMFLLRRRRWCPLISSNHTISQLFSLFRQILSVAKELTLSWGLERRRGAMILIDLIQGILPVRR